MGSFDYGLKRRLTVGIGEAIAILGKHPGNSGHPLFYSRKMCYSEGKYLGQDKNRDQVGVESHIKNEKDPKQH